MKTQTVSTTQPIHFLLNRKLNIAEILTAPEFRDWEVVQCSFRVGFKMSDGNSADGIGRCKSMAEFERKAAHGGTRVLNRFQPPLLPQPVPSFSNHACIECGEWSASGGTRCEDCQEDEDHD